MSEDTDNPSDEDPNSWLDHFSKHNWSLAYSNDGDWLSPQRNAPSNPRPTPYPSPISRGENQTTTYSCNFPMCASHMKLHKQGKSFRCTWPGCGKGYAREDDHKRHEQLHNSSLTEYASPLVAETPELHGDLELFPTAPFAIFTPSQQQETSTSKDDGAVNKLFGACRQCKSLKVKCEFDSGMGSCKECLNGGHECQMSRTKRGRTPSLDHQRLLDQIHAQEIEIKNLQTALDPRNDLNCADELPSSALLDMDSSVAEDMEFGVSAQHGILKVVDGVDSASSDMDNDADVKQKLAEHEELLNVIRRQCAQIEDLIEQLVTRGESTTRRRSSSSPPAPMSSVIAMSPQPPLSNTSDNQQIEELIARLTQIFATKDEYRRLLSCRGTNAQKVLDMFQRLLDLMTDPPTSIHRNLIAASQRLSAASGLYPKCYELNGVTDTGVYECSGGFADVYKAYFRDQAVCLKTIRLNSRTDSERFLKAVSKEAILWGQLRHPNVLPFYGIFHVKDRISFVSPWMENGDVSKFLGVNQSSNRVLLCFDVAQGLHFLHQNDIVHGDLKGGNILVNKFGRACIADLGLSSVSDKEILAWTSYSSVASKGGTIRWQAPELFNPEGDDEVHNTKASDIYAWACVAYEIFTGQVPLAHLTRDIKIVHKVLDGQRPARPPDTSLSWSVWGLTEDIWGLIETCWSSDPAKRPNVTVVSEQTALPMDAQRDTQAIAISPGKFREMTRHNIDEVDELSVEMLTRFMATC